MKLNYNFIILLNYLNNLFKVYNNNMKIGILLTQVDYVTNKIDIDVQILCPIIYL